MSEVKESRLPSPSCTAHEYLSDVQKIRKVVRICQGVSERFQLEGNAEMLYVINGVMIFSQFKKKNSTILGIDFLIFYFVYREQP